MQSFFKYHFVTTQIVRINSFLGYTNEFFYLVIGDSMAALIDTGYGIGDLRSFVSSITDLPVIVLNTHAHPDHIGGDFLFPSVYICPEDMPMLQKSNLAGNAYKTAAKIVKNHGLWLEPCNDFIVPTSSVEMLPITDGKLFNLGGVTLESITMPGHSPGCVSFLYLEQGILFSGDNCGPQPLIVIPADNPKCYSSLPLEVYYKSLCKLVARRQDFCRILNCHKTGELPIDCLLGVLDATEGVLSGRYPGVPTAVFGGAQTGVFSARGLDPENIEYLSNGFCGDVIFAKDNLWTSQCESELN